MHEAEQKSLGEELQRRSISKAVRQSGSFDSSAPDDLARSPAAGGGQGGGELPGAAFRNAAFDHPEHSDALSAADAHIATPELSLIHI